MLNFAIKRLGVAVLVAITVSLLTFSLLHLTGDPAILHRQMEVIL